MFEIGPALAAAARFWPAAWRACSAALALCTVTLALALRFGGMAWLVAVLAALVARGGLLRLALGLERPGPGGLQAGRLEARLAAVWALTALFLAVLVALALVVALSTAYAVASAGRGFDPKQVLTWAPAIDARGHIVLGLVAGGAGVGIAWAWARTSLAEAASSARGRIEVLNSWKATSGKGWRLVLAHLVLASPLLAASLAAPAGAWPIALVEGALLGGVWLPMTAGLMAYAWRTEE
jgi:hypothetical protein